MNERFEDDLRQTLRGDAEMLAPPEPDMGRVRERALARQRRRVAITGVVGATVLVLGALGAWTIGRSDPAPIEVAAEAGEESTNADEPAAVEDTAAQEGADDERARSGDEPSDGAEEAVVAAEFADPVAVLLTGRTTVEMRGVTVAGSSAVQVGFGDEFNVPVYGDGDGGFVFASGGVIYHQAQDGTETILAGDQRQVWLDGTAVLQDGQRVAVYHSFESLGFSAGRSVVYVHDLDSFEVQTFDDREHGVGAEHDDWIYNEDVAVDDAGLAIIKTWGQGSCYWVEFRSWDDEVVVRANNPAPRPEVLDDPAELQARFERWTAGEIDAPWCGNGQLQAIASADLGTRLALADAEATRIYNIADNGSTSPMIELAVGTEVELSPGSGPILISGSGTWLYDGVTNEAMFTSDSPRASILRNPNETGFLATAREQPTDANETPLLVAIVDASGGDSGVRATVEDTLLAEGFRTTGIGAVTDVYEISTVHYRDATVADAAAAIAERLGIEGLREGLPTFDTAGEDPHIVVVIGTTIG